ncbi:MAG: FkbM family methyltransferase, partial [Pseudorhodoplanes sp.]|nr:FkbM family methyltransferase [Pseudorhodoplanes sp.]
VEAHPGLAEGLRRRFAGHVANESLFIVEAAISDRRGHGDFFIFGDSVFGTISPDWVDRNAQMGLKGERIAVNFTTLADIYEQFGVPYYLKVDVEGADALCIDALKTLEKPEYLSIEAEKHNIDEFIQQATVISQLGYDRFQAVQQELVPFQRVPDPPREGLPAKHRFPFGSSGLFGRELPDAEWKSLEGIIQEYRPIVRRHAVFGDFGWGKRWAARQALRLVRLYPGWHDLHAARASSASRA